jgi:hypothetical protein
MRTSFKSCQPPPGCRPGVCWLPLAGRGCTLRWARRLQCATVYLLLLGLAGCGATPERPEREPKLSELVGTWTQDTSGTNPSRACLHLSADHTCAATNFFVVVEMSGIEHISGAGKWRLTNYPNFFGWTVVVTLPKLGGHGIPVQNRKAPFLLGRPGATPAAHRLEDMSK